MNNIPNKIFHFLGYNNLAFMMEQERKHWLLKTDRKKHLQSPNGEVYQGEIDNLGSDLIIEASKLPVEHSTVRELQWQNPDVNDIVRNEHSALTHNAALNGLMFARIISMNFPVRIFNPGDEANTTIEHRNYRVRLRNCEVVTIPFGASLQADEVFSGLWVRTRTAPQILLPSASTGAFDEPAPGGFSFITGTRPDGSPILDQTTEYYIPFSRSMQPVIFNDEGNRTWTSEVINENNSIGYPLFWFVNDTTRVGPTITFDRNLNSDGQQMFFLSNSGNTSKYKANIFANINGATPNATPISNWSIICRAATGHAFRGNGHALDLRVPLNQTVIGYFHNSAGTTHEIHLQTPENENTTVTMHDLRSDPDDIEGTLAPWIWMPPAGSTPGRYRIPLSHFNVNQTDSALIPVFDIHFDETVPFGNETTDWGSAGMRASAANVASDKIGTYPHNLNLWDGLPYWMRSLDPQSATPQHLTLWAVHNTPGVDPEFVTARQTAALLFDPGITPEMPVTETPRGLTLVGDVGVTINRNEGLYELRLHPSEDVNNWINHRWEFTMGGRLPGISGVRVSCEVLAPAGGQIPNMRFVTYNPALPFFISLPALIADGPLVDENTRPLGDSQFFEYNTQLLPPFTAETHHIPFQGGPGPRMQLEVKSPYWFWMQRTFETAPLRNDQKGRMYIISNDPPVYENNSMTDNPKPPLTGARICDLPTTLMQLSNPHGTSPVMIVDPNYVRNEAAFTEDDLKRIKNVHARRWVKPSDVDSRGRPISTENGFVFQSREDLNRVELVNAGDFMAWTNLNAMVNPFNVQVASISNPGSMYAIDDWGHLVVGGFAFKYVVTNINPDTGQVTHVKVMPAQEDSSILINASNFNMVKEPSGHTEPYQTSRYSGEGTGLSIVLVIVDWDRIKPRRERLFEDLFALVDVNDILPEEAADYGGDEYAHGVWLFAFIVDPDRPRTGKWMPVQRISLREVHNERIINTRESFLNSIIPSLRNLQVNKNQLSVESTMVQAFQTASFVNIVDKTKYPIALTESRDDLVDLNGYYCDGILEGPTRVSDNDAFEWVKTQGIFDCYIIWQRDPSTGRIRYGIIRRSFNNFMTQDELSLLPRNDLRYSKYVHTNSGTNVVWDVPGIGTMMWVYNPKYNHHEQYGISIETGSMTINTEFLCWQHVKLRNNVNAQGVIIDEHWLVGPDNKIKWNVTTNNPVQASNWGNFPEDRTTNQPRYQQPEFLGTGTNPWIPLGADLTGPDFPWNNPKTKNPQGGWQLVYPEVMEFDLRIQGSTDTFHPMKMQAIRGTFNTDPTLPIIVDRFGNNINGRTLLIDRDGDDLRLGVFNTDTNRWVYLG